MSDTVFRPEPYEGNEDYIFISYSHRDAPVVFPLLRRLQTEGYRFWYDEGIDPGTEWPEAIATHLSNCRLCIAFISASSLASQNCRREINFALAKEKEFLSVFLEPVEMSPGMEMQISTYQSIFKYKYANDEQFLQKLFGVGLLDSCKKKAAASAAAKAAPGGSQTPPYTQTQTQTPSGPQTASAQPTYGQARTAAQPAPPKAANTAAGKTNIGKVILIILAIVAAIALMSTGVGALVVIVLAIVLIPRLTAKRVTIGSTVYRDKGTLRINSASISSEQMRALASFKRCKFLYLTNCSFENGALRELTPVNQLTLLSLTSCQGVGALSCLDPLPNLRTLCVINCGLTDDKLVGFLGPQLVNLDLSGNVLTKAPELANPVRLKTLSMAGNRLTDLTLLSRMTGLTRLDIRGTGLSIPSLPGWTAAANAGVFTRQTAK